MKQIIRDVVIVNIMTGIGGFLVGFSGGILGRRIRMTLDLMWVKMEWI